MTPTKAMVLWDAPVGLRVGMSVIGSAAGCCVKKIFYGREKLLRSRAYNIDGLGRSEGWDMEPLFSRAQEVRDLTEDELWDLYARLRYFTHKRYGWLQQRVSGGVDLDALIQDAILDVITGMRKSPPHVPLFILLCQTIRSKASHLWEKEKGRLSIEGWQKTHSPAVLEYLVRDFSSEHPHLLRPTEPSDQQAIYSQLCNKILDRKSVV
jgi:hypothetical protein